PPCPTRGCPDLLGPAHRRGPRPRGRRGPRPRRRLRLARRCGRAPLRPGLEARGDARPCGGPPLHPRHPRDARVARGRALVARRRHRGARPRARRRASGAREARLRSAARALRRRGGPLCAALRLPAAPARAVGRRGGGPRSRRGLGLRVVGDRALLALRGALPASGGAAAARQGRGPRISQQEQQDRGSSLSASMSLLTSLLSRPLDPGYEAAARKKALEGPRRRSVPSSIVLVLFAAALGALTVTAA